MSVQMVATDEVTPGQISHLIRGASENSSRSAVLPTGDYSRREGCPIRFILLGVSMSKVLQVDAIPLLTVPRPNVRDLLLPVPGVSWQAHSKPPQIGQFLLRL